ncbi:MAG: MmpS family transport accessory protein [Mycobacterium sp.]
MTSRLALSGCSILFAVAVGFAATCGVANAVGDFPQVRYEVSGSGVADTINYQLDTGQKHIVNVPLPWSTQFTSFGGQVFVLSAEGQGQISCNIVVDGNSVFKATASGTPGRAVCSH